jgi:hypothetical protein
LALETSNKDLVGRIERLELGIAGHLPATITSLTPQQQNGPKF